MTIGIELAHSSCFCEYKPFEILVFAAYILNKAANPMPGTQNDTKIQTLLPCESRSAKKLKFQS
jgi:hypothetical protein